MSKIARIEHDVKLNVIQDLEFMVKENLRLKGELEKKFNAYATQVKSGSTEIWKLAETMLNNQGEIDRNGKYLEGALKELGIDFTASPEFALYKKNQGQLEKDSQYAEKLQNDLDNLIKDL